MPPSEAITISLLFLAVAALLLFCGLRWRQRAPRLAVVTALWALVAFAIPGLLTLAWAPAIDVGADESQPYVALFILWLLLLVPTGALLILGRASLRA